MVVRWCEARVGDVCATSYRTGSGRGAYRCATAQTNDCQTSERQHVRRRSNPIGRWSQSASAWGSPRERREADLFLADLLGRPPRRQPRRPAPVAEFDPHPLQEFDSVSRFGARSGSVGRGRAGLRVLRAPQCAPDGAGRFATPSSPGPGPSGPHGITVPYPSPRATRRDSAVSSATRWRPMRISPPDHLTALQTAALGTINYAPLLGAANTVAGVRAALIAAAAVPNTATMRSRVATALPMRGRRTRTAGRSSRGAPSSLSDASAERRSDSVSKPNKNGRSLWAEPAARHHPAFRIHTRSAHTPRRRDHWHLSGLHASGAGAAEGRHHRAGPPRQHRPGRCDDAGEPAGAARDARRHRRRRAADVRRNDRWEPDTADPSAGDTFSTDPSADRRQLAQAPISTKRTGLPGRRSSAALRAGGRQRRAGGTAADEHSAAGYTQHTADLRRPQPRGGMQGPSQSARTQQAASPDGAAAHSIDSHTAGHRPSARATRTSGSRSRSRARLSRSRTCTPAISSSVEPSVRDSWSSFTSSDRTCRRRASTAATAWCAGTRW